MSRSDEDVRVVLITAPDADTGARIARALVEERLVACVNLVPGVRSIYRWEDAVQDDAEVLLVAKTASGRARALADRVREVHPYDVPEVLVLPVEGGSAPYLDWVREEVSR
ncbi:MAG: divalent-cation tolerance protein CutA [Myxococcota bacterium]|nr:divalent-cation tolerance protein CutA [Myxococcota bacterium]